MIKQLRLKNFKSYRDSVVNFGTVSIILGANGAGKSNLFDALRFLKAIGDGRNVRDALEGHASPLSNTSIVPGVRGGSEAAVHFRSNSSEFEIGVTATRGRSVIRYQVVVDVLRHRVIAEELKATGHPGDYVFSTRPDTGPLKQDPEAPVISARFHKAARGLNPKRDFSPHEFILSQFTGRRAESNLNEDIANALRDEFASLTPLELRPEVLRQYSPTGRAELGEHGENFAAAVWRLISEARMRKVRISRSEDSASERNIPQERLDAISAWLTDLTPKAVTGLDVVRAPTGEVLFSLKERDFESMIPAPSLSDGTLRFAALALASVGGSGRRTLIIEEIENGVSPSRLAQLIGMLEQASDQKSGVQVIASTHSSAVLDFANARTRADSTVVGWDSERSASHPIRLDKLPGLERALEGVTLGGLQEEGWLQQAASI